MAANTGQIQRLGRSFLPPLAYIKQEGVRRPGILYIGGFMSSLTTSKSLALETMALQRGHPFVRFDYSGLGESVSSEAPLKCFSFEQWRQDVLTLLDQVTDGPQIVVGSSMGGWLAFLTALERPNRIVGLCGVSIACGFFPKKAVSCDEKTRERLMSVEENVWLPGPYGDFPLSSRLLSESALFDLTRHVSIPIVCPLRCLHSLQDDIAPYKEMLALVEKTQSTDVKINLVRSADHRMADENSIAMLCDMVASLLQ